MLSRFTLRIRRPVAGRKEGPWKTLADVEAGFGSCASGMVGPAPIAGYACGVEHVRRWRLQVPAGRRGQRRPQVVAPVAVGLVGAGTLLAFLFHLGWAAGLPLVFGPAGLWLTYWAIPPTVKARDPATAASLGDPTRVGYVLDSLRQADAHEQVDRLLARDPATAASLEDPGGVALLLHGLREAGAHEQADRLLARDPATAASLEDPGGVASLLHGLREAGAHEQADRLLARDPATAASLEGPGGVARLLDSLREAGAHEQADRLLARDPATAASLENQWDVDSLL
jgi:uncharacterized protein YidB (DUF937 family)